jgi:anaerobic magnesium-protoporphyrin IX monomethyl ester cyclase
VVLSVGLVPFVVQDFSSVSQRDNLKGENLFSYDSDGFTGRRSAEEVLATMIAMSRKPNAPAFLPFHGGLDRNDWYMIRYYSDPNRFEIFRWTKALQRGIGIFLESYLDGTRPDTAELRRLRDIVLPMMPSGARRESLPARTARFLKSRATRRLSRELFMEVDRGVGPLVRTAIAISALRDTGQLAPAVESFRNPDADLKPLDPPPNVRELARELIERSIAAPEGSRAEFKRRLNVIQVES